MDSLERYDVEDCVAWRSTLYMLALLKNLRGTDKIQKKYPTR